MTDVNLGWSRADHPFVGDAEEQKPKIEARIVDGKVVFDETNWWVAFRLKHIFWSDLVVGLALLVASIGLIVAGLWARDAREASEANRELNLKSIATDCAYFVSIGAGLPGPCRDEGVLQYYDPDEFNPGLSRALLCRIVRHEGLEVRPGECPEV